MATLQWEQVNPFSIALDSTADTWNAGHVNDILAIGYSIIVASDTGGVWLINPAFDAIPQTNRYPAICLSNDWLSDSMSCLAFGPDGQTQAFAGPYSASTLYALTFQLKLGEVAFVQSTAIPLPWWAGGVSKVIVQQHPRRIIVACANALLWSAIPTPFDQVSGYAWQLASHLPLGGYSGLALGPGTSVIAAAWGADVPTGRYGIFVGNWNQTATDLSFTRASISGSDPTQMLRTSIASCAGDRSVVYAVSDGANDTIYNVLRSQDGGQSWSPQTIPPGPGNQGWYNNCIDVNPTNPYMVVLGWRHSGPFLSTNGAQEWNVVEGDGLHSDVHVVYFPGLQSDPNALFVGSDGGVALVQVELSPTSRTPTYAITTGYNMHLLNLQLYGGDDTASYQFAGLYAGGTQDNGNIACVVDPGAPPLNQPWVQLDAGDGGVNRFLSTGQLLRYNNTLKINDVEVGNRVRVVSWDPNTQTFQGGLGSVIVVDGTQDGLPYPVLEVVNAPQYSRNNQVMYAIGGGRDAATGTDKRLYGLFADQDGANMHWTPLASVSEQITAVASGDGNHVIIGTDQGHLFRCATPSGIVTEMALSPIVDNLPTSSIDRLLVQSDTLMFALHHAGYVLRFDGGVWDILPSLPVQGYAALETDWTTNPKVVYLATDTSVFASADNGESWSNESSGLPASPHCADLRFVVQPDESRYLYLGTYGRSLWRAFLGRPPESTVRLLHIEQVVRILYGVIQDGGGWTTGGPEPPWGPEQDLFVGVLAAALAQTLPGAAGHIRAGDALQFVSLLAGELLQTAGQARGREQGMGMGMGMEMRMGTAGTAGQVGVQGGWRRGASRAERAAFKRIVRSIARSQGAAGPAHQLLAGMLAASLARQQGGGKGRKRLGEALRFIEQRAQQEITAAAAAGAAAARAR